MYGKGVVKDLLEVVTRLKGVQFAVGITNLVLEECHFVFESRLNEFP